MNDPEGVKRFRKLKTAVNLVSVQLPFLDSLARIAQYCFDRRTETACVFRSGRILIHPEFFDELSINESVFVIAHELMHLQMQSHDRLGDTETLGNIAHDLIINDMLRDELNFVPAWVLRQDGASQHSVERLVGVLRGIDGQLPTRSFNWPEQPAAGRSKSDLGRALADAGVISFHEMDTPAVPSDVESTRFDLACDEIESEWFGNEEQQPQAKKSQFNASDRGGHEYFQSKSTPPGAALIATVAIGSTAQEVIARSMGDDINSTYRNHWLRDEKTHSVARLQDAFDTPLELIVQTWIDSQLPSQRSFSRPSRRAGNRCDVVLPGRKAESQIANFILDTSGSMWKFIPSILSLIADSVLAGGIEQLRVIQCDIGITRDEVIQIDDLDEFVVSGFRNWEGQHVPETPEPPIEDHDESIADKPVTATPQIQQSIRVKRSETSYSYNAKRAWFPDHAFQGRWPKNWQRVVRLSNQKMHDMKTHLFPVPNHPAAKPLESETRYRAAPDSNLVPAIVALDDDPTVTSAIVITDGIVDIPGESPAIEILWVVLNNDSFDPEYGTMARITVKVN